MEEVSDRLECLRFVRLMLEVKLHLTQRFFFTTEFFIELRELQKDLRVVRIFFKDSSQSISRLSRRIRNNRLRPKEFMPRIQRSINKVCLIAGFGCNRPL